MEAPISPTSTDTTRTDELTQTLVQQRGQVETFLAAHRKRMRAAESNLAAQIDKIGRQIAQTLSDTHHAEDDLAGRSERLEEEARVVKRLKAEIQAAQAEWRAMLDLSVAQQKELAEEGKQRQTELDSRLQELADRQLHLAESEAALREESVAQQEKLAEEGQRRQTELDARLQELADRELRLAEAEAALRDERQVLAQTQQSGDKDSQQWEKERESLRTLRAELETHRRELDSRQSELERRQAEVEQSAIDNENRLQQRQAELAASPVSEDDDLRRRYEMAMEDIRELRARSEDAERALAEARTAGVRVEAVPAEKLDWEAQKRRLLATLEADFEENDDQDAQERLKIEEVIETTNRIVADREREVDELKQLLREQGGQVGSVAVGAAMFGEMLDKDAIVQEERANLKQLQNELREKLRQAEIEISIERAKFARERVEMEEKLRVAGRHETPHRDAPAPEASKPARGRWLSRLGLKEGDEGGA
jgi:hypothetical protein